VRLSGKTAVVTGGLRGIGRATVECLRAEGARVVPIDIRADPERDDRDLVVADVTDPEAIAAVLETVAQDGGLDICVGNAGMTEYTFVLDATPAHWRKIIDVNLLGLVNTFTAAARVMVRGGRGGSLVATASVAGLRGESGGAAYCASKAAVISVCQSMALELAPHRITVNAVAPGEVDTELHAGLMRQVAAAHDSTADEVRARFLRDRVPIGRMAAPREVADAIAFLASPAASYITGETVRVDGGELLT
jgi:NAD(P)-dependent dehydrogenase (short-subunit alcohol dehydrogenase family)